MSESGADVGWFSTGHVGLCGFADRSDARRAGEIAGATLADWYKRRWNHPPEAWTDTVPSDDAIEFDGVCIGRLSSRHLLSGAGPESWGIEFRIPRDTWVAVMLELAQRMHAAVKTSPMTERTEDADVHVGHATVG